MAVVHATAYRRPETLEEAYHALGPGVVPVAGGTDVILHAPAGTRTLLDLSALSLDYVKDKKGFAVGAMTTLTGMLEHPGLAAHLDGVLARTLRHVGTPLLRNAATIGGHLARGRLSDIVPTLLAMDTTISIFDGKPRSMPLAQFYADELHRERLLITEIGIPAAAADTAAGFLKLSLTHFDLALLNCACLVRLGKDGNVEACRIVVGETPALGAAVPVAEGELTGGLLNDDSIAAAASTAAESVEFGTDSRASAAYRKELAAVAVRRVLNDVRRRFEERRR
jgi:CO/xanthine dehydrogenase FAD-binding subunit